MCKPAYFALSAGFVLVLAATLKATTTPVVITSASVAESNSVLTLGGSGFSTGGAPTLIFGGAKLGVKSFTNTSIEAALPSGTKTGNYQVTVRNSEGQSATATASFDNDAVVTNGTLTGNGTKCSPLGVKVGLVLNSSSETTPTMTLSNNSASLTPALNIPIGSVAMGTGNLSVTNFGTAIDAEGLDGGTGVSGGGATGLYGVACCSSMPVYGTVGDSNNQGGVIGIYGIGGSQQDEFAGVFDGDVTVNGKLTKSGGSFKIDHPLDPANKYLSHSFVESPDMMNIYNGNVITDRAGNATVTLPDWFEALNRDFRYQLTVIGQFAQAIVASKITSNQFVIRTDKPNVEVSWQVTGIRQDGWANAHRIPVEEVKPEKEKDFYLHPELYNQPPQKSIEWARHPEAQKKIAQHRAEALSKAALHVNQ